MRAKNKKGGAYSLHLTLLCLHRSCRDKVYDAQLPNASVIFCYHNEARSALLRSIRSVINRTPPPLLAEIILVDDNSDHGTTEQGTHCCFGRPHASYFPVELDDDIRSMDKIRYIRLPRREGLIRGRTVGADAAVGEV